MIKKGSIILISIFALFVLAACSGSSAKANSSSNPPSTTGGNTSSGSTASGSTALENRLAPGILKLEGSSLAITAQQATQLLPLWQQVQTLNTSGTAQTSDYTAVYQQIESALTSDQINAIQAMSFNQSDIQALMTSLGIQITPGAFGGNRPTLSPDQQATRTAQRTLTPGAPGGGGFSRGSGTPPAGGQFGNRGMNTIFLNPLIQLLQQRAGS
jgi:hypothetical protein